MCSCIVFPITNSLREDKPLKLITVAGKIHWDKIKHEVASDPEFLAVSARQDLQSVLTLLSQVNDELLLDKLDSIQIYRGGIDLLRIVLDGNSVDRSAYIEINDYRRRLSDRPPCV
ncbi:hypothetical protein D3C80_1507710 [compost metagenome]